ncbi:hypothetical protein ALO39_200014 [Pseudomonas syringae pv. lapsa]|nr:hypothetical protein ALO39_200014 [Pseudomonas syringae pv. lapsa]
MPCAWTDSCAIRQLSYATQNASTLCKSVIATTFSRRSSGTIIFHICEARSLSHSGGSTFVIFEKAGSALFSARLPGFPASAFLAVGLGLRPRPATVAVPPIAQLQNF